MQPIKQIFNVCQFHVFFILSSLLITCVWQFNSWLSHILFFLDLSLEFIKLHFRLPTICSNHSCLVGKSLFCYFKYSYFSPILYGLLSTPSFCWITLKGTSYNYFADPFCPSNSGIFTDVCSFRLF